MRFSFASLFRRASAALAVLCLPIFTAGWLSGPQSTFDVKGPVAKTQLDVFYVTVWVTMIVFVIVAAVLAYATLKFKARNSKDENAPVPDQGHGNPFVELGLIGASVAALVIIAVPTLRAIWYTYDVPEEQRANAYEVTAVGLQWWFQFEYPSEQIEGAGQLITGNELVIPAGRPVRVNLRTRDVIHSFWVPKLAGKVDMIPNRGNHLWLQADEPGYFWGQCAEYCGESHAVMRFRVIALAEDDFTAWVENQKKPARIVEPVAPKAEFASYDMTRKKRNAPGYTPAFDEDPMAAWIRFQFPEKVENPALVAEGRKLFRAKNCITCHAVRGHEGVGVNGPDLTHFGSRTTLAAGLLENSKENLHRWVKYPEEVKPGNKMWVGVNGMAGYLKVDKANHRLQGSIADADEHRHIQLNDDETRAIVEYLHSLK
ncbi:MAG: cytochrome c oxidase subunit II [Verrucomicrobia bacterium]|nr:MAG: cytochrome c oxidase subunit II [Verrucomicrobiota bacterium]